jgi:hypothetical protein
LQSFSSSLLVAAFSLRPSLTSLDAYDISNINVLKSLASKSSRR